jgi:hypothetical protein
VKAPGHASPARAIKYRALHNLIAYNRFCGQNRSE